MTEVPTSLPGHDLVADGLADLTAGRETPAALLVTMAAPRLRPLGFEVPQSDAREPSHRLYELLEREGPGAHGRYNALVRRSASFARAAEHAISAECDRLSTSAASGSSPIDSAGLLAGASAST